MTFNWNTILDSLAAKVGPFDYKVYLAPVEAELADRTLRLRVRGASNYLLGRLETRMGPMIRAEVARQLGCAPDDLRIETLAVDGKCEASATPGPAAQAPSVQGQSSLATSAQSLSAQTTSTGTPATPKPSAPKPSVRPAAASEKDRVPAATVSGATTASATKAATNVARTAGDASDQVSGAATATSVAKPAVTPAASMGAQAGASLQAPAQAAGAQAQSSETSHRVSAASRPTRGQGLRPVRGVRPGTYHPANQGQASPSPQASSPAAPQDEPATRSRNGALLSDAARPQGGSAQVTRTAAVPRGLPIVSDMPVASVQATSMHRAAPLQMASVTSVPVGTVTAPAASMTPVAPMASDTGGPVPATPTGLYRPRSLVSLDLNQPATVSGSVLHNSLRSKWRYTFDDFVIGPSNRLAASAAQDVCNPSGYVETLFVSSEPGLGKTHIVQSAVRQILEERGSHAKVAYLTADDFYARFRQGLRTDTLEDFTERVRALDFLLVEDVQNLHGKEKTQELLLNLVKQLQNRGSKVVFTSRFRPRDLTVIDPQLLSLLSSGVQAVMEEPTYDMRCEILRRKAGAQEIRLDEEVVSLIATRLEGDVRRMESCLKTLLVRTRLLGRDADGELAQEVLELYGDGGEKRILVPSFDVLLDRVLQCYGLTASQLCSCLRRRTLVEARNVLFYLARKHTSMTLEQIGARMNKRHSTVLKGIAQVERVLTQPTPTGRETARVVELIEKNAGCAPA